MNKEMNHLCDERIDYTRNRKDRNHTLQGGHKQYWGHVKLVK